MEYSVETYHDIVGGFTKLLPEFFEEVDIYPENPIPNLDHAQFKAMDESGSLLFVCAMNGSKLVGFHITYITPDIFYKHIKTAYVLCYFLKKENRGNGNGTKMFEFADKMIRSTNAERIFMSRKIYMPNEKIFNKLGYTHVESGYTKYIGDTND